MKSELQILSILHELKLSKENGFPGTNSMIEACILESVLGKGTTLMFLFLTLIISSKISFKVYILGPHKSYFLLKLFISVIVFIIKFDNSSTNTGANLESWQAKGNTKGMKSNKLLNLKIKLSFFPKITDGQNMVIFANLFP